MEERNGGHSSGSLRGRSGFLTITRSRKKLYQRALALSVAEQVGEAEDVGPSQQRVTLRGVDSTFWRVLSGRGKE